jgi:hypothetical protein
MLTLPRQLLLAIIFMNGCLLAAENTGAYVHAFPRLAPAFVIIMVSNIPWFDKGASFQPAQTLR